MKNKKWIFLFLIILTQNLFADGTYFLPGSGTGVYSKELAGEIPKDEKNKVYFIPDALKQKMMELDEQQILWAIPQKNTVKMPDSLNKKEIGTDNHFIMESQKGTYYQEVETKRKSSYHFDQIPQGTSELPTNKYIESDVFARLKENRNKGESAITFTILYDGNTYSDSRGVFDRTFGGDGAEWYNSVWAVLSSEFYLFKDPFNFAIGGNLGAGYKSGYGVFAENQKKSDTKFNLLTVPLDFSVIVELNLWNWVRFEAFAGPSVMFLIQNRDDRESDEDDKTIGQLSYGYFGGGRFKLSLGQIFPETNKAMYETNDVTNYFVTFDVRYQSYGNFKQDDIEISGVSAGVGLAFEFL